MKILAVDTALGACSVAITDTGKALAHRWVAMPRGHAEELAPMVERSMADARLAFSDVERLAVTTGPGTFTGQRVGLAFMRGLRVALGRPLIGVTTLEAMAAAARAQAGISVVAVVHEAKRGDVYGALYHAREAVLPARVLPTDAMLEAILAKVGAEQVAVAGTAAPDAASWLASHGVASTETKVRQPDALWVAKLAEAVPAPTDAARPLYLRAPDAKLAAKAIRLRPAMLADAPLLANLHAQTMRKPWDEAFFRQVLEDRGGFAVVAEAHETPLGYVLARAAAGEAEILSIGVLSGYRRSGVARRLLADAAIRASALGATTFFLEVDEANTAARRLYECLAFAVAGRRKGYYAGEGGGDALLMKARLPFVGNGAKLA
ncbi:MAG TPA: tRNA (adenosine(37)-N6)-threonylcarbamoyltransferase complex dimerization subunit type 1 TsaB [Rhizomicrobium sp.]|nr:tRNA (adenosine(37)-N6)-threonylcarbamoyltransferase complex dimerization subunit type 1 TsaB [Rhizomicrobium sp.]